MELRFYSVKNALLPLVVVVDLCGDPRRWHSVLLAHRAGGGAAARAVAADSDPALLDQGNQVVDLSRRIIGPGGARRCGGTLSELGATAHFRLGTGVSAVEGVGFD